MVEDGGSWDEIRMAKAVTTPLSISNNCNFFKGIKPSFLNIFSFLKHLSWSTWAIIIMDSPHPKIMHESNSNLKVRFFHSSGCDWKQQNKHENVLHQLYFIFFLYEGMNCMKLLISTKLQESCDSDKYDE